MNVGEFIEFIDHATGTIPAHFSKDRKYRNFLRRPTGILNGQGVCTFVGGNPSKADEERNDLTVTKGVKWAGMWGFEWFWMLNLHALVGTDPKTLIGHPDPVGEFNDLWLKRCFYLSDRIVVAFGELGKLTGRDRVVVDMLIELDRPQDIYCFGLTQTGYPKHPSRIAYTTPLIQMPLSGPSDNGERL